MKQEARSAIITGASSGIGLAIVKVLLSEGFGVSMIAREAQKLEQSWTELATRNHAAVALAGDIADESFLDQVVDRHVKKFGGLNVLVNNAGISGNRAVADIDAQFLDRQIDVNLRATILLTSKCLPMLSAAADGQGVAHIICTASNAGLRGEASLSSYSATKAGIVGFTQAIHDELASTGIKATAICPGLVNTPLTDRYASLVDPDDMIDPYDVAEAVRFIVKLSAPCIIPEVILLRADEWRHHRPEAALQT